MSTSLYQPVLLSHKMNPQIQQALANFSALLESRNSFLSEVDCKKPLDGAEVVEKVKASVISLYEERCMRTGCRKMSWIFNRDTCKFELNRVYKASKLGYQK